MHTTFSPAFGVRLSHAAQSALVSAFERFRLFVAFGKFIDMVGRPAFFLLSGRRKSMEGV